jgi:glycosyltransferase involved in cell wall biosynthesis
MSVRVAAIVPAFNEEPTVGSVVGALLASPSVDEVIVVCDGSVDGTAAAARAAGATVYELPENRGKGAAMLHGLTRTDAPVVAFFDADLTGLSPDHAERLVLPVVVGSRVMNVGLRDRGPLLTPLTRHLPLIGGERAMLRQVIEEVPPEYLRGFMVETALNYYCRSRGLAYGSVLLPGLGIRRKYQKVGWKRGMLEYVHMAWQVAAAMAAVRLGRLMKRF